MKKLAVMFLGILMVVSLVGCGGGGGPTPPEKGATMDTKQLETRFEETIAVAGVVGNANTYKNQALALASSPSTPSMSLFLKSQNVNVATAPAWSPNPDAEGWYSASYSMIENFPSPSDPEVSFAGAAKMRYLASTGITELDISLTAEFEGHGTVSMTIFTQISKNSSGLWKGYITMKASHAGEELLSIKQEFADVNVINGCGEYTFWEKESKTARFTITVDADGIHMRVKGETYNAGVIAIEFNKLLAPITT